MSSRGLRLSVAALGGAFLLLTLWVRFAGTIPGDGRLLDLALRQTPHPDVFAAYQFFGGLGSPLVAPFVTLAAAIIVLRNVGAREAGSVVLAAAGSLLELPVAHVVGHTDAQAELARPAGGFPSGHAAYATATFGMVGWLAVRHGRPEVAAVAGTVTLLMGIARVADHSHLLDEVLAGYLLGGAWLCLVLLVAGRA